MSCLFGLVIYGSQYIGKKTIVERMMGATLELPKFVWVRANFAVGSLMMVEGIANIYVLYNFDTDTWFNIKFYGMTAFTILFMLLLGLYLARYVSEEAESQSVVRVNTEDEEQ